MLIADYLWCTVFHSLLFSLTEIGFSFLRGLSILHKMPWNILLSNWEGLVIFVKNVFLCESRSIFAEYSSLFLFLYRTKQWPQMRIHQRKLLQRQQQKKLKGELDGRNMFGLLSWKPNKLYFQRHVLNFEVFIYKEGLISLGINSYFTFVSF